MAKVMNSLDFINKLIDIATNYKTLYVMGCFGAPMTPANKPRYCTNHEYNKRADRTALIKAADTGTFGFDCVCLIKGVLWGWNGNASKTYGGAYYLANDVPDVGANTMITYCSGVTTDFSKIEPGEAVWCDGHIGVYIGDGLAVECTPLWKNGVQITAVKNIGTKSGYNARTWTKHGKLPYIEYVKQVDEPKEEPKEEPKKEETKPATTKVDYAQSYDKKTAGVYKITASAGLHIRAGASTKKKSLGIVRHNELVNNYGYYTYAGGSKWLYVKTTEGLVGFCHSSYLTKQ